MTAPTGRRRWRYLECPTCESCFRVEAGQPLPSHRRRRPGAMDILEPCPAVPAAPATAHPTYKARVTRTMRGRLAYQIEGQVAMVVAADPDPEAVLAARVGQTVTVQWNGYDHAVMVTP